METKMTRSITEILEEMEVKADAHLKIAGPNSLARDLSRALSTLRKAIEELEKHTEATTGYYSGMCTGDSYDAQETLKEIAAILEGGK